MRTERERQRRREEKRRYRKKHRDKWLEEKKRYREKHKEELKEKRKIYYLQNKEKVKKKIREWKRTPKGRFLKKKEKYKRKKKEKEISHSFTLKEWLDKVKSKRGICPVCKKPFDKNLHRLTLDHIIPISKISKGFVYTIKDVEPICLMCNSKKGDKLVLPLD